MEVGAKELRQRISEVLERVARGEEVIVLKRGKPAARIVPAEISPKRLPAQKDFRGSIRVTGGPLSALVRRARDEERY